jgi:MFS family permease
MAAPRLTLTQWLICGVAALGFAFDIYAVLMLPLIVGPALGELGHLKPGMPAYSDWVGYLFYLPAVCGGIFGMIGGYLTDLWGRQRVLVWSILLYTLAQGASAFATSLPMLLVLRCLVFVGVCVEFVAAVAWLAEVFDDHKQREKALGWTQAFSSAGGFMVSAGYYWAVTYGCSLPAILGSHTAWRYTLMSGVIPAIPLIIIRPFLPESPKWKERKAAGTLKRPSFAEIFSPQLRRTTIVSCAMFALSYGAAFGAIQQLPQIVPGLPEIKNFKPPVTPAAAKPAASAIAGAKDDTCTTGAAPRTFAQQVVAKVQGTQEIGGLFGRIALAFLAVIVVSRRSLLRIFMVPGMVILPLVFFWPAIHDLQMLRIGIFFAGFFTVAQLSFWGNYLPLVYPVHLRGTGESFAANVGGRTIGTSFAWVTAHLATHTPGATPFIKTAYAAAMVGLFVYVAGFVLSFWLPEPSDKMINAD